MIANRLPRTLLPLGIAGAIAAVAVATAGFTTGAVAKAAPDRAAAQAQAALAKGQYDKAIALAEAVVAAAPREPSYRALLAQAYLKAGRFDSAVTTYNDALSLGDNTARTALALALAEVAAGRPHDAVALLDDWHESIPASDLGLALALAGETGRGVTILGDALRGGENTVKVRQNLAYAYALDGRWLEARTMLAQDVPADMLDARISDWALKAKPEDARLRIAALLKAPLRADPGQPALLALNHDAGGAQLAVQDSPVPAQPAGELAPAGAVAAAEPAPAPVSAPASGQRLAAASVPAAGRFVARPVVQPLPAGYRQARAPARIAVVRHTAAHPAAARPVVARAAGGPATHAVQLGSFTSEPGARRAWSVLSAKNPELRGYRMTISTAQVNGKQYWRVGAAGFSGNSAAGVCSAVKARGGACFAYAAARGLPAGKAAATTRMAATDQNNAAGLAIARKR